MNSFNHLIAETKKQITVDSRVWKLFRMLTESQEKGTPIKFTSLWKLFWTKGSTPEGLYARKLLLKYYPELQVELSKKNLPKSQYSGRGAKSQTIREYHLTYTQASKMALVFATSSTSLDILEGYEACRNAMTKLLRPDYDRARSEANLRDKLCSLMSIVGTYGVTAEKEYLDGKRRIDIVIKPCQYSTCIELKAKKVTQSILDEQLAKWYPEKSTIVIVAPSFEDNLSYSLDIQLKTVRQFVDELRAKKEKAPISPYSMTDFNEVAFEITKLYG